MNYHLVCFSGGHSSALVALEVARRYGTEGLILLNHDIHPSVEHEDVKRFKAEVSAHLGVPISYANHPKWDEWDQFDVCVDAQAFKVGTGSALCSHRLKTQPFEKWLAKNFKTDPDDPRDDITIYYGFDPSEPQRIQRRASVLARMGYRSDFPLALWPRTVRSTAEVGVKPPLTYGRFKHANCLGCLKAGAQHWYVVFSSAPEIWEKALAAEEAIGYSILGKGFLDEMAPLFAKMRKAGIEPTEQKSQQAFWAEARRKVADIGDEDLDTKPCECVI